MRETGVGNYNFLNLKINEIFFDRILYQTFFISPN